MSSYLTVPASSADPNYDVVIVGAGPVGLTLAALLAHRSSTRPLRVALIDAREATRPSQGEHAPPAQAASGSERESSLVLSDDPRALTLSPGSRMLLEPLGWPAGATPIERIHVSQRGHFGRTLIDRDEHRLPALGYVIRYGALQHALSAALDATSVIRFNGVTASWPCADHAHPAEGVELLIDGRSGTTTLHAQIVVNAKGGLYGHPAEHRHPAAPLPQRPVRDYQQTAIVGTVSAAAPQPRVAWERFTREGPLALLPVGGAQEANYALVWCQHPDTAARRMRLPDAAFSAELRAAFGDRMGAFTCLSCRKAFPLGLAMANASVGALIDQRGQPHPLAPRIATIGNAAQILHPVAGQGLNLGLRDAYALAEAFAQHGATPAALVEFTRRRVRDRHLTISITDMLARTFTFDVGPFAALRGLALTALDCMLPAKRALTRQLMFGQRH